MIITDQIMPPQDSEWICVAIGMLEDVWRKAVMVCGEAGAGWILTLKVCI